MYPLVLSVFCGNNRIAGKTNNFSDRHLSLTITLVVLLYCAFATTKLVVDAQESGIQNLTGNNSKAELEARCSQMLADCSNTKIVEGNSNGIPRTEQAVNASCRAFETNMKCYKNYADICMSNKQRQKLMESVHGAREGFYFLCRDPVFRRDYLLHGECYHRVEKSYDECAQKFISTLKSTQNSQHTENGANLCCLRQSFMKCVDVISSHHCSPAAAAFLKRLAMTLVNTRASKAPKNPYEKCDSPEIVQECLTRSSTGKHFNSISLLLPSILIATMGTWQRT